MINLTLFCKRKFSNISTYNPWSFCEVRICPFASRLSRKKTQFFWTFSDVVIFSGWEMGIGGPGTVLDGRKNKLLNETQEKGRNKHSCEKVVVSCCHVVLPFCVALNTCHPYGTYHDLQPVKTGSSAKFSTSVAGRQRWSRQLVLWEVSKIRALILWAPWFVILAQLFGVHTRQLVWNCIECLQKIDIQAAQPTEEPLSFTCGKIEAAPCTMDGQIVLTATLQSGDSPVASDQAGSCLKGFLSDDGWAKTPHDTNR